MNHYYFNSSKEADGATTQAPAANHIFKVNDVNEETALSGVWEQPGSVVHLSAIRAFCSVLGNYGMHCCIN